MSAQPSTRVWRQLAVETATPCDQDAVLRMALAAMAADPTSGLSKVQRLWVIDLAHRTTRLTPAERAKLQTPLLEWVARTMPRCYPIIAKQFMQEDPAPCPRP